MDYHMPQIPEHSSLSTNEAEDDNEVSSVSDCSSDDHLNRRLVTDTYVTRPQSCQEIQLDNFADAERNFTALPPIPLHHSARIVSPSISGSYGHPNPQPENGNKQIARKAQDSVRQTGIKDWKWEILALLVSILALTMIALILYLYQGRSLQDWPYAITINSLIAVFSTVMKGALFVSVTASISQSKWDWFHREEGKPLVDIEIYDGASRGPWGALWLLTEIKWRHFSSLGAIIIVLALAIDPITQQAVSYSQAQSWNVTIPSSFREFISNGIEVEPSIKDAVFSGLFGDPSTMFPTFSSGNITGQQFESLAVCDSCNGSTKDSFPDKLRFSIPSPPLKAPLGIINASMCTGPGVKEECTLYWCLKTYAAARVEDNTILIEMQASPLYDGYGNGTRYNMMPAHTHQEPFWVDVQSSLNISAWMKDFLTDHRNKMIESIEYKFHSIALALTDQIQRRPNPNDNMTIIGKAQAVSTFRETIEKHPVIYVQWAWLALPIGLIALALIFQILTMVRTSRRKTALWKSSTLALFFHGRGVQEVVHMAEGERIDHIAGMEEVAGRMKVRLETAGGDWRFMEDRRGSV